MGPTRTSGIVPMAVRNETGDLVRTTLTRIAGLARAGAKRLQIEGVRLAAETTAPSSPS